jgi:DNA polymerase III subunit beta
MRFTVQREVLMRPLMQVVNVVERRQTMAILSNLLVVARNGRVSLTATDLEVEIKSNCAAEISQDGETTLPARKFADIVKAMSDGSTIDFKLNADRATLSAGKSRFQLACLSAQDFPAVEAADLGREVSLPKSQLAEIIERAAFAMAHQDVRYYLNGLLLELKADALRGVATDGHRLSIVEVSSEHGVAERQQMIVPRKGVLELQRMVSDGDDPVVLAFGRSHVQLKFADGQFTSKLIDGKFPDYESVVPAAAERRANINRLAFREALDRVAILSSEKYRGVRLEFHDEHLDVTAHNPEQEEAHDAVSASGNCAGLSVGFNVNYLKEALGALRGENILFCMRDGSSSALLREVDNDRVRQVVMPLKL